MALFGAKASFSLNTCLHNYFNPNIYPAFHLFRPVLSHFQFLQSYQKMSLIKVAWYVIRVKICILGHPQTPGVHEVGGSPATYIMLLGKVKSSFIYQNSLQYFTTSLMSNLTQLGCTR